MPQAAFRRVTIAPHKTGESPFPSFFSASKKGISALFTCFFRLRLMKNLEFIGANIIDLLKFGAV
jgi:hypothetical protein